MAILAIYFSIYRTVVLSSGGDSL